MQSYAPASITEICASVYTETQKYYREHEYALGSAALGFRVLYGPPIEKPPFLFLGFQPGGRKVDCLDHHKFWPESCDYATQSWPLAKQIRAIWGPRVVERCTGLNVIFFRAPNIVAWNKITKPLRRDLEKFSCRNAERIVRALQPECMIIIGLGTFRWLTKGDPCVLGEKGRVLALQGKLWGCAVIGTIHLSGSRVSTVDRERLRTYFAGLYTG